jgi:TDG/mug DNA glycosylase family protein
MDKVPFYSALKKFRDYLNGLIPEIDENEVIFNDPKIRAADDGTEISEHVKGLLY